MNYEYAAALSRPGVNFPRIRYKMGDTNYNNSKKCGIRAPCRSRNQVHLILSLSTFGKSAATNCLIRA